MKKHIAKLTLKSAPGDLDYWLARTPEERIAAVETLRYQAHSQLPDAEQRLQRVYRVTQLKKS